MNDIITRIEVGTALFNENPDGFMAERLANNFEEYFKSVSSSDKIDKNIACAYSYIIAAYEENRDSLSNMISKESINKMDDAIIRIETMFNELGNVQDFVDNLYDLEME